MALLYPMFSYSLAMSITPGPANMMFASYGINFGFKKTFPFLCGAVLGFTSLLFSIGFGLSQLLQIFPAVLDILTVGGALFIIWMAIKLSRTKPDFQITQQRCPKFYQGMLFQWINPKAWISCMTGVSCFSQPGHYQSVLVFVMIYFISLCMSGITWTLLGDKSAIVFKNHVRLKVFNQIMALMLIFTAGYLLCVQFNILK